MMSSGYNLPLLLSLAGEIDNLLNAGRSQQIDDFAYGVYPHQLAQLCQRPQLRLVYPGSRTCLNVPERDGRHEKPPSAVGKDGFQVCMDVQQFRPNELSVKSLDNAIIIEGKHEEREDEHGFISRHFVRRYMLPKGYDPNQIMSSLSSDGVLTIRVPNPTKAEEPTVRVVQIQQTGPAHLSVKENQEEAAAGEGDGDGKLG